MFNITYAQLAQYKREQLQEVIRKSGLKVSKLSRKKHEEMMDIIMQNKELISPALFPALEADIDGVVRRRGRKPQYSEECKEIIKDGGQDNQDDSQLVLIPNASPSIPISQLKPNVRIRPSIPSAAAIVPSAIIPNEGRVANDARIANERQYVDQRGYADDTDYDYPEDSYVKVSSKRYKSEPQQRYSSSSYLDQDYDDGYLEDDYIVPEEERYVPVVTGILDLRTKNCGFLRGRSYNKMDSTDVSISWQLINRYKLRIGDLVCGTVKTSYSLKYGGSRYELKRIISVNGVPVEESMNRPLFDQMVPVYPKDPYVLEGEDHDLTARIIDLFAPIGKGQRALIVSPPKAGKTICLKKIAAGIERNFPDTILMALLVDERPEEVTDMERSIQGEVIASTFDEEPKTHIFISQLVLERARRLVELGNDVVILLDSLTRLGRAYNNDVPNSGRTMSGGLDISALRMPKKFFGSARKIERGGSLTIVATALIDTGSRMDEVIFEEFKGTGNSEINLSRKLSEKRIFPAIDVNKSSTRHDECLQDENTLSIMTLLRRNLDTFSGDRDSTEVIIENLKKTVDNADFLSRFKRNKTAASTPAPAATGSVLSTPSTSPIPQVVVPNE
ncbi:transcription termination factor Rho [bacterium]|nr:transcription termination factor Rho [bacterium]